MSSPDLAKLLKDAGISVFQYETLLPRNQKIADDAVIARACQSGFILVTKDEAMEREWIGSVIQAKARMILLMDGEGGIVHLAAALICAHDVIERVLLNNPMGPLIIKVNSRGDVTKIRGEAELNARCDQLFQASVIRAKRSGDPVPNRVAEKRKPTVLIPVFLSPKRSTENEIMSI